MNLNQIAAFLKVVETGSFTLAGSELSLSPSAVSKHVGQLEQRLGVRLLTRTTRRLALTDAGAAFHARCGHVVAELAAAAEEARGRDSQLKGSLRVHVTPGVGQRVIAPLILAFMKRYADVSVHLTIGEAQAGAVPRDADVLITISHRGDTRGKSVRVEHLREVTYLVCASQSYLERHGAPRGPEALKSHACLIHEAQRAPRLWRFRNANGTMTSVNVDGPFATNNSVALESAVLDGLGVGRVPDYVARAHLQAGRLVMLFDNLV
ncbi:MAG TPA: LysR family transcriptional regulator, partial [Beijerinckiaceae bacterium]